MSLCGGTDGGGNRGSGGTGCNRDCHCVVVQMVMVTSGGTGCNRDCHCVVVQMVVVTVVVLGAIETVIVWWYT